MEYSIVAGQNLEGVIAEVNKRLADGWSLHGGVSVAVTEGGLTYAQAMTKNKPGESRQSELKL